MNRGYTSVPFKTKTSNGMSEINGVAKFSSAGVVLEFESKLFGIIPTGVKEVRLPLGEISDIQFRKGILKRFAKIEIRMNSFASMAGVPNTRGRIILKIFHDDFDRAKQAAEKMQKDLAEYTESLPPPHTPVGKLFEDDSEEETRSLKQD